MLRALKPALVGTLMVLASASVADNIQSEVVQSTNALPVIEANYQLRSTSRNRSNVWVVANDSGGDLIRYAQMVSRARTDNTKVQISGSCASACTLFLSLAPTQTCITRGASFLFHRAHSSRAAMNAWGSDYLMRRYPEWVQSWIEARGGLTKRLVRMNYAYASQHLPTCGRAA